jgi:hypothetical protein
MVRQLFERRHGFRIFNEPANFRDFLRLLFKQRWFLRFAPFARTKAGPLGVLTARVELNVLRSRQSRRARRPAIHTGGFNRVIKLSVRRRIVGD